MRRITKIAFGLIMLSSFIGMLAPPAEAGGNFAAPGHSFSADLTGFGEVPVNSTPADGELELRLNSNKLSIDFELTYSGLQGTVTQAHVHFGQHDVNGGIMYFLCSNLPNPPAGTAPCPVPGGTVTGTITGTQVVGPAGQGIVAGEFAEVLAAMRSGNAYANVHTSLFPAGEIRGQVKDGRHGHDDHDGDHDSHHDSD